MSSSAKIECGVREKVGSRSARKLRAEGRVVGTLQADANSAHLNIHFDAAEFGATRRAHTHLYDLDVNGELHSAVIRELQWDVLGDHIVNVEFKRVTRGVETESEVELAFLGTVSSGILTHNVTHITISCLPSIIPDVIEVNVNGLDEGAHIKASDLVLPEGVKLAVDGDLEVAVVSATRAHVEETPGEGEGEEA
ncbi:MAG: 50S ribosomal protein L25 [Planctomycetes bacterium]|nr:50S ribosomal protein L25 [Planctomycetota bacterium]